MTLIRSRKGRQKRNRGTVGRGDGVFLIVLNDSRTKRGRPPLGSRSTFDRSSLPLTELQALALDALTDEPQSLAQLAAVTGRRRESLRSVLLALQGKNLARRRSDGTWIREPEAMA